MGLAQSILFSLSHNEETLNNAMYIVILCSQQIAIFEFSFLFQSKPKL